MCHDPEAAYEIVNAENMAEKAKLNMNRDEIHLYLDELAKRCEVHPSSFEE
jgi:hypothetical protein